MHSIWPRTSPYLARASWKRERRETTNRRVFSTIESNQLIFVQFFALFRVLFVAFEFLLESSIDNLLGEQKRDEKLLFFCRDCVVSSRRAAELESSGHSTFHRTELDLLGWRSTTRSLEPVVASMSVCLCSRCLSIVDWDEWVMALFQIKRWFSSNVQCLDWRRFLGWNSLSVRPMNLSETNRKEFFRNVSFVFSKKTNFRVRQTKELVTSPRNNSNKVKHSTTTSRIQLVLFCFVLFCPSFVSLSATDNVD